MLTVYKHIADEVRGPGGGLSLIHLRWLEDNYLRGYTAAQVICFHSDLDAEGKFQAVMAIIACAISEKGLNPLVKVGLRAG